MKSFLRSNTFKILIIIFFIISAISILSSRFGDYSMAALFGMVTNPMKETVLSLTDEDELFFSQMSREELEEYCATLQDENDELRSQLVSYYDLKLENELYESALEIIEQKPEYEIVPALVVSKNSSDVFGSFVINAGSSSGITVGDCVITSSGFVGVVSEVSSLSANVSTIFSEDVSIGATSKEYGENGVVTGNAEAAIDGYVLMEYLDKSTNLEEGTIISTSGVSEIYPEDIIIGSVVSVQSSTGDISKYAYIEPYVDILNVSQVFVVTNFTVETVENVTTEDDEIIEEFDEELEEEIIEETTEE